MRPRRASQLRTVLMAALVLVAVVAGVALTTWHRVSGTRSVTAGRGGVPAAGPVTPSVARPVPASAVPATGLGTSPAWLTTLSWTDFYGVKLPVSKSAGPRHVRRGLAWGFADTPAGALLAAVNIGVRANAQWGPAIFGPTIRDQVTGPGAPALLAACQASYDQASRSQPVPAGQPLGPANVTEAAFGWVYYSPAAATVDIVSAGPGDQGVIARAVTRIEVMWSGGDWRVIAPPGGDWGNSAAPLTSLSGYTIFPVPSS